MIYLAIAVLATVLIAAVTALNYISIDLGSFIIFITIIGYLIAKDRRKVKRQGIILIRRTLRGREFIDKVQKRHTKIWGKAAKIGIIVAVVFLVVGTAFLANQTLKLLAGGKEGGVRLLLPGPVSTPLDAPGIFVVPWWIWIIGVAVVIVPHEFMHGIMCSLERIRIKSVGWILLLVIPGAFVEPDEKQLQRAKRSTKLKVYAAGSFANIVIAFAILIVFALIFAASFRPAGLAVNAVPGSPANISGLHGAIASIDGHDVRNKEDLTRTLSLYKPGDTVSVRTVEVKYIAPRFGFDLAPKPVAMAEQETNIYTIILAERNDTDGNNAQERQLNRAFLGVAPLMEAYSTSLPTEAYSSLAYVFLWIYVFSLGIGIVNLLPLKPLDGGLIFEEIVGRFTKKQKLVTGVVSSIILLMLLFNLVGPVFL
ncbi:MAG: site-2 protease family protein [Candidatus Aenigmarchaeota archaeon]|nr:site-2 protease family protein [Candidatus Aenigmarchaeota archaeon]